MGGWVDARVQHSLLNDHPVPLQDIPRYTAAHAFAAMAVATAVRGFLVRERIRDAWEALLEEGSLAQPGSPARKGARCDGSFVVDLEGLDAGARAGLQTTLSWTWMAAHHALALPCAPIRARLCLRAASRAWLPTRTCSPTSLAPHRGAYEALRCPCRGLRATPAGAAAAATPAAVLVLPLQRTLTHVLCARC